VMTRSVVTVRADASLDDVIATMEQHRIRRVPVIDDGGACTGIIAQADIVADGPSRKGAELVREVSRSTRLPSH